ncbi:hypothetical protein EDC19_0569 [Natranaerovirga hydrolytica]|uniref:Uncharacterized protein n=1 Tax=Natranaerovirga hydrolytica TaxID=680378 RepID=A0A4V2Q1L9_9FIRM|nr:hypothetical protein [Natranaerovirga hydrolytica]TCK98151.1 hypothetical protein EDC19_0569 [Natranaerovirga hydrolytica]
MGIYNLVYYAHNAPKKVKKKSKEDIMIHNKSFNLTDLSPEVYNYLFELIPNFRDLSSLNLTVEWNHHKIRESTNYIYIRLNHINDIYFLFGLSIDIESIVNSLGKVYVNEILPITTNRVEIEEPKIEICMNKEYMDKYTFGMDDSPNKIIYRMYCLYNELMKKLRQNFIHLEQRKKDLDERYRVLFKKERDRLNQLKLFHEKANEFYKKDKYNWISTHGSKHLRLLYSLNYEDECEMNYILERTKNEFEGWILDINKEIVFNKRSHPTPQAMTIKNQLLEKDYHCEIVWIKKGNENIKNENEAVVIFDYLHRHRLYLVI